MILNPFQWTYEDQLLDLTVQLPKDHVNLLSFPFSAISSLKNAMGILMPIFRGP